MNRLVFRRQMQALRDAGEIDQMTNQDIEALAIKLRPETFQIGTTIHSSIFPRWHVNRLFVGNAVVPMNGQTLQRKDHPKFFAAIDEMAKRHIGDIYVVADRRTTPATIH